MKKRLLAILFASLLGTIVAGCDEVNPGTDQPGEDEIGDGEVNDEE